MQYSFRANSIVSLIYPPTHWVGSCSKTFIIFLKKNFQPTGLEVSSVFYSYRNENITFLIQICYKIFNLQKNNTAKKNIDFFSDKFYYLTISSFFIKLLLGDISFLYACNVGSSIFSILHSIDLI